jgi:hypothetical protein
VIGPSAEVLQWAEQTRRLNGIYQAWIESAAAQGAELELPAMPITPVEPTIAEAARGLSDDAEGPGPEGDDDERRSHLRARCR